MTDRQQTDRQTTRCTKGSTDCTFGQKLDMQHYASAVLSIGRCICVCLSQVSVPLKWLNGFSLFLEQRLSSAMLDYSLYNVGKCLRPMMSKWPIKMAAKYFEHTLPNQSEITH